MRVAVYTWFYRNWARLLSAINIRTIWNVTVSCFTGFIQFVKWANRFVNADSKPELKAVSPDKHERIVQFRMLVFWVPLGFWAFLLAVFTSEVSRPRLWLVGVFLFHAAIFTFIGRNGTLMVKVQTSRMAGEQLFIKITDELTLTEAQRNPEGRNYAGTASIHQPPARLASNKGYDCVVRVNSKGDPIKLLNNPGLMAHKLDKGEGTVFLSTVASSASLVRILVLDINPWTQPPTQCPLVARPRVVNLWREPANLGTFPDYTAFLQKLVEEGEGGGLLIGGAPRAGKSTFISTLLCYLMLDPTANIHLIDGSAVDYDMIKHVCASYVGEDEMEDIKLLRLAHGVLRKLKTEVNRRKSILKSVHESKLTEKLAEHFNLGTHWYIIDELAILTEDLYTSYKDEVNMFKEDLQWLVRTGPKYGVIVVLGTQRPSEKSTPPAMKGMIVRRIAFYIAQADGSYSILGKGGIGMRADKLDPTQKGVAIGTGVGQFRGHNTSTADLARIAKLAAVIRSQAGTVQPDDTKMVHPRLIRILIEIFSTAGADVMKTVDIIEALRARGSTGVNEKRLADSLKPFGISPKRPYVGGEQIRGYLLSDLQKVPKTDSFVKTCVTPSDSKSSGDGKPTDTQGGSAQAARLTDPEE
jgi:hypothetical protein